MMMWSGSIIVSPRGLVVNSPEGLRSASTSAPLDSRRFASRSVVPASGEPSGIENSRRRNSSDRSCITTSTNSATFGLDTNDAMRAAPSSWGLTTRSAPACWSLGMLSSARARATMNRSGTRSRHDSVTKRFSASVSIAATSARARSTPAASRTSSCVASPITTGNSMFVVRSMLWSITTTSWPSIWRSWATALPTRPQPHTIVCPLIWLIRRSMRRLPTSSLRWPSTTVWTTRVNV